MSALAVFDGATWRTATAVSLWDGSAWRSAKGMWVWDGSAWRQGFAASLGTIPTPSISAAWDFTNHRMVVTITPAQGTPTGVTWVVAGVPGTSATGGTTTTTTYIDAVNPEDGSQSCYICHGTKSGWTSSADSNEACDFRGNAT